MKTAIFAVLVFFAGMFIVTALHGGNVSKTVPAPPASPQASPPAPAYKSSVPQSDSLEQQAASIIRSRGYWCGRVANINPTFSGQSPNKSTFRIFCDDGRENATYIMEVGRGGSYVTVREN